eukprot:gene26661-biopygen17092
MGHHIKPLVSSAAFRWIPSNRPALGRFLRLAKEVRSGAYLQ